MASKLSVITISYNDRSGLQRTVESVQRQDVPIEHIIVDGNSSDGTAEYLESLPRKIISASEPDHGRYDAMNKGASIASGEYLWFMHSGDLFASDQAARHGLEAVQSTDSDWAYGLSRVIRNEQVVGIGGRIPFSRVRFAIGLDIIPHQATIIRRQLFDRLGGFDLDFGLAEDQRFFIRASLESRPHTVAEFLCNFDGSGAGSVRNCYAHYQDMARARKSAGLKITSSRMIDSVIAPTLGLFKTATKRITKAGHMQ